MCNRCEGGVDGAGLEIASPLRRGSDEVGPGDADRLVSAAVRAGGEKEGEKEERRNDQEI
ncbi:MAG: hypothetical protein LLH30_04070 [Candidatus Manganitrophus sp. SA1]|nr:hypothetical protein [Candidatus Manganitrophus morganii]